MQPSITIWNRLDWKRLEVKHHIEAAAIAAVIEVESNGHCFDKNAHPILRYERHVAWRVLVRLHIQPESLRAADWLLSPHWSGYGAPQAWVGWEAYRACQALSDKWEVESAAIQACSWGFAQILGEGYESLGYHQASDFRRAQDTVSGQIDCLERYMSTSHLWPFLTRHDWLSFAQRYNGPAQKQVYADRLHAAFLRFKEKGVPPFNVHLNDGPGLPNH